MINFCQAHDLDLMIKNNIQVEAYSVRRAVDRNRQIKSGHILVNRGNEDLVKITDKVTVVPVDDTWMVVRQWENNIFVDDQGDVYFLSFMCILSI